MNDENQKYFKDPNDKYLQKLGTAKSYEEGRAFDLALCICLKQTALLRMPSIVICSNHSLVSVSEDEVTEQIGVIDIPSITIDDLYYQLQDQVYLSRPNNKKIIFERVTH